jgi:DNA-binding CsgD family transcriptional regulator
MYVRALSPEEQAGIEAGLRSSDAFTLRRSQILLASSREQRPKEIARNLGCATQTVRNAIHAFEQKGLACLKQESSRPKTVRAQSKGSARSSDWQAGCAHHPVLVADQKSLAEPNRAEVGSWQARDCRTCSIVDCK